MNLGQVNKTNLQYNQVRAQCRDLFYHKLKDYGTSWRILRNESVTDQIFIKANRIRSIELSGINKVGEDISAEYIGIINYSIIGLIQLTLGTAQEPRMEEEKVMQLYDQFFQQACDLMQNKNHDYGEAWRDMRLSSITDLILVKVLRTRQIEDNKGATLRSEGIDANYLDMINYGVFALIRMQEMPA